VYRVIRTEHLQYESWYRAVCLRERQDFKVGAFGAMEAAALRYPDCLPLLLREEWADIWWMLTWDTTRPRAVDTEDKP
jgi:hypothetical protein